MTAEEYQKVIETIKPMVVEEDEYFLEWVKFHEIHPDIERWEYEMQNKKIQEM